MNPFRYGKVVTTPYFTGRETEIKEISTTLFAGNNVILVGQRRIGKTSLIKEVLKKINSSNMVYLDLYSVVSQKDFINKYAEAIFKTQKIPIKKLVKKISGSNYAWMRNARKRNDRESWKSSYELWVVSILEKQEEIRWEVRSEKWILDRGEIWSEHTKI